MKINLKPYRAAGLALASVCVLMAGSGTAMAEKAMVDEARAHTKSFSMALKSALETGMKSGGPMAAIEVCNDQAPRIAQQVSKDGWVVARTALKVRNADNAPDQWETAVMNDFISRLKAGESPDTIEVSEIEGGQFRYMKMIPTAAVCLACHGSDVAEPVAQKIASLYPQDQAVGFKLGELRGAFTLRKSLVDQK